jgi:hypothetical protein
MPKSYDTVTAELSMTLSTLAYVDENMIASQLEMIGEINAGPDEGGYKSWQVAWGPALNADRSNLVYAREIAKPANWQSYAAVISRSGSIGSKTWQ